jgi:hypothetical protein
MERLHSSFVVAPLKHDCRTDLTDSTNLRWLGYPMLVISDEILCKGRADFTRGHIQAGYPDLTPEDKVQLYCLANMPQHFLPLSTVFSIIRISSGACSSLPGVRRC